MKRFKNLIFMMILTIFVSVGNLYAEEVKATGIASVDVMSNYVWRGLKLSNSWVVQPSVGISYGNISANLWANYDADSKIDEGNGHGEATETDLTLNYSRSIDKWNIGAGYIYYGLNGATDTQEIYLSVGYNTLLSPTLTAYYDYDEGKGAFVIASIGHTVEVSKTINLKLGASASYNINNKEPLAKV